VKSESLAYAMETYPGISADSGTPLANLAPGKDADRCFGIGYDKAPLIYIMIFTLNELFTYWHLSTHNTTKIQLCEIYKIIFT
jgi:hypothetical protein